jgi:hypothetical protein
MTRNSNTNDISILMNKGDGTFFDEIRYSAGEYPNQLVATDLNNDSFLDILVQNNNSTDISILINNKDGTFKNESRLFVGYEMRDFTFGDIDKDGNQDILVSIDEKDMIGEGFNACTLYLGNGYGTFRSPIFYITGKSPIGGVLADLNNDGFLDLVVGNSFSWDMSVFINTGENR